MRIIGIDPGLRNTGFGVIEVEKTQMHYIASGVVSTEGKHLPDRIKTIFNGVQKILSEYQPHCAAIEKVFVNVNPQSTLDLGQARGAALSALVITEIPVREYTALQIKQSVVGKGRASKTQVQAMVQHLLRLQKAPRPDAADALAVAISEFHIMHTMAARTRALPGDLQNFSVRIKRGRII